MRTMLSAFLVSGVVLALLIFTGVQDSRTVGGTASAADPLLDGFKKSTVASVSDAVDQIVGQRGYMSHDMRPRVPGQIVARARTALVRPVPAEQATPALAVKHSVEMIEAAKPGEVGIIVMEDGLDVAAIGGLMATAAKSRSMAGIIADGGVRDLAEMRGLGMPVYSRSISPSSAVGRYATVDKDIEVKCGGVIVRAGDIIVAGEDGVVVVPQDRAAEVLKRSQEIDEREMNMVPFIQQFKSLTKAIEKFNRI